MANKKIVPKKAPTDYENIRTTVDTWANVSAFLKNLARDVANVPSFPAEIVRSALMVSTFLDDRIGAVKREVPDAFREKENGKAEPATAHS